MIADADVNEAFVDVYESDVVRDEGPRAAAWGPIDQHAGCEPLRARLLSFERNGSEPGGSESLLRGPGYARTRGMDERARTQ